MNDDKTILRVEGLIQPLLLDCQYCARGGCYRRNRLLQSHLGQQLIDEIIIRGLLALRFCSSSRIRRTFTLLVIIKYVSDANHETRG